MTGWPKYGNWGFSWPIPKYQNFTFSTEFCDHMNRVALDVIRQSEYYEDDNGLLVMDGFWLSHTRPDHTEVNDDNGIGPHLVHPGPEVIHALTVQWLMVALRHLFPNSVREWEREE